MIKGLSTMRVLGFLAAAGFPLTTAIVGNALAASNATQICEARWEAHIKTLPALPPASAKSAFIEDCIKQAPPI